MGPEDCNETENLQSHSTERCFQNLMDLRSMLLPGRHLFKQPPPPSNAQKTGFFKEDKFNRPLGIDVHITNFVREIKTLDLPDQLAATPDRALNQPEALHHHTHPQRLIRMRMEGVDRKQTKL